MVVLDPSARLAADPNFYWEQVTDPNSLSQGDHLINCMVPLYGETFGESPEEEIDIPVVEMDLIVVTQACDLEQNKVDHVALCPIYSRAEFELNSPGSKIQWEQVRKGMREGLCLLGSQTDPADNQSTLVVDFRQIISLPISYLKGHATRHPPRFRLRSPYLEHFSQAFARFFMRVGLPGKIPPFK